MRIQHGLLGMIELMLELVGGVAMIKWRRIYGYGYVTSFER